MHEGYTSFSADEVLGQTIDRRRFGRTPVAAFILTLMLEEMISPSAAINDPVLTYEQLRTKAQQSELHPLLYKPIRTTQSIQRTPISQNQEVNYLWSKECGKSGASVCFSWVDIWHPADSEQAQKRVLRLSELSMLSRAEVIMIQSHDGWGGQDITTFPDVWGRDILPFDERAAKTEGLALFYAQASKHPYTMVLGNYSTANDPVTTPINSFSGWQTPLRTGLRKLMIRGNG